MDSVSAAMLQGAAGGVPAAASNGLHVWAGSETMMGRMCARC